MIAEADLLRLETLLAREPIAQTSMSLSMIDGMLTTAVIGPRAVMPSEFIPWIWDHEKGQAAPEFHDQKEAQDTFGIIMAMQNRIASELMQKPPQFTPLFLIHDGWSHAEWMDGFEVGMNAATEAWEAAIKARKDLFGPIVSFGESNLQELVGDDWPEAVANLRRGVIGFRDYFRGETMAEFLAAHTPRVRQGPKVGRNDPCPCGSGRKFKKCCGAAGETVH